MNFLSQKSAQKHNQCLEFVIIVHFLDEFLRTLTLNIRVMYHGTIDFLMISQLKLET